MYGRWLDTMRRDNKGDAVNTRDILVDAYGRIIEGVNRVTHGLDEAALTYRPDADANSIGWLVWHLIRVQDHHVSELAGVGQAWMDEGWAGRFGMPAEPNNVGYGHTSEQVAAVRISDPQILCDYAAVVHARTLAYLETADAEELSRIVDTRWDPPVTAGVRLVSVIGDDLQHLGQAAYVRGLYERLG
jgi:hypothetical protein